MLPVSQRIPSFEIPRIMKSGFRVVGGGVTMILDSRLRGNDMASRFTFIVSTKVDKRAVVRNRMRRVMSESVAHLIPELKKSIDAIFIGSKSLIGLSQKEVEERIKKLL